MRVDEKVITRISSMTCHTEKKTIIPVSHFAPSSSRVSHFALYPFGKNTWISHAVKFRLCEFR
ncbi:hypothetical protein [Dysgonomonas mossii]|uniref:hypothetical protein n=1 Tax=Dysgonomonas mossii TaxID=163665 RepID=UPI001AD09896|nr:hypothetical protein [Dysgonomonas mossii]MBN9300707.1 hypothetical protein [Dysgonomonas mossii]